MHIVSRPMNKLLRFVKKERQLCELHLHSRLFLYLYATCTSFPCTVQIAIALKKAYFRSYFICRNEFVYEILTIDFFDENGCAKFFIICSICLNDFKFLHHRYLP